MVLLLIAEDLLEVINLRFTHDEEPMVQYVIDIETFNREIVHAREVLY
jgi:hypothetical protein